MLIAFWQVSPTWQSAVATPVDRLYFSMRQSISCKAMTYNILVSRPMKYHLTMRARGYYLLLYTERVFFQETPLHTLKET